MHLDYRAGPVRRYDTRWPTSLSLPAVAPRLTFEPRSRRGCIARRSPRGPPRGPAPIPRRWPARPHTRLWRGGTVDCHTHSVRWAAVGVAADRTGLPTP